ncbi:MAG: dienelactone hydrolase family protein [Bauldia sp.]
MNRIPKVTQAMIDLYDDYTHLTLDRRGFMAKLAKLAGGGAAAAAILPMIAASPARAAMVAADDARLKAERVEYPGADGVTMKGYLVLPAGASGKLGAVIVVHENRGLNAHIEDVARRMALEGFLALAPDFLSPQGGTPGDEDKARELFGGLDLAATIANGVRTVDWLKRHERSNGKVGAVGFCWGGGTVNQIAVNSAELAAAVAYYGAQPSADDASRIRSRVMLHYAGLDERINANIADFEAALKAAAVDYRVFVYDGVNHAFNNDTSGERYDKTAADLAWSRTVAFFKETLA